MNIKERIQQYLDYKGINTSRFESSIDASNSYWRNTKNISAEMLPKIFRVYSDLSLEWVLYGDGDMIKKEGSTLANQQMQVLHHPKSIEKIIDEQFVTLYDVDAAANLKTLFDNKDQHKLGEIRIPNMPKCDGAVYVKGDSMYPLLKSGDIIMYKELQMFENIIFGEMYLVSMEIEGDEYLAVKYVNKSDEKDCIKLVSYNTHHEPKDVKIENIRAMALVKVSIRMNTMR